jgi:hypothetical protein
VSTPRWYRGTPPWLCGVVISLALLCALGWGGWLTLSWARADERAAVVREGDALTRLALARGDSLAREADSLRAIVAHVDTVLVTRIRRIRDTAWLPADTAPAVVLGACRSQLDSLATDCDTFRRAASTALAQADTITRRDAAAIAGLSLQLAAVRRADSIRATQGQRRSRFRRAADGVCVGAVAAHLFQWSR